MKNFGKEIKSILLSDNGDKLERINELLNTSFETTFSEVFRTLEDTIINGTLSEMENVISNIEILIMGIEDNHNFVIRYITETINKVFGGKNLNSSIDLKFVKYRLLDLNRKLNEKIRISEENNITDCNDDVEENIPLSFLEEKYHVSFIIPDDVINELNKINIDTSGRVIFDNNFITIDGDDALCLDDAISLTRNKDGSYYLDIAITDIPSVISYDSLLYREASKRIETLYLCDDVCDLYPKEITNNLCSLLPHVFRNAIVYRFLVDSNFCVDYESLKIIKGVINVNSRLTYSDVNNRVNIDDKTIEMIEKMYMLAMKLRRYNTTKEKYRKIENIIKSDANYHHSLFANKSISANIIQEAMILVNSVAPEYFSRNGFVYLYRNLFIPTDEYLEGEVNKLLLASKNNVDINSPEYKAMVEQIRSIYLGAYYSNVPIGHMGIGRNYYSHSTSSARRFADSYNQYLTYFQIFNGPISDKKYYELEKETSRLANYINMKKRENAKFESEYNYLSSKGKILRR